MKLELLAPAGSYEKLKTAFYFGADAAYIGGKSFSLRSFADNFDNNEIVSAVKLAKNLGKKLYVTVNIFASNSDFGILKEYFLFLNSAQIDAVILTDPGIIDLCAKTVPKLPIHISTQANTTNKYAAKFWADIGAKRIILARELSLKEIKEIREHLPQDVELEAFCHGAMCISMSGRCLLSDYLNGRSSNRGACVQACRWHYDIREHSTDGEYYPIEEDERGTYILNSKDLNMIDHLSKMADAGITSFKIEGRMKSDYYVATVVNAYRRAFDALKISGEKYSENRLFYNELLKTNHRAFTTAYAFGKNSETVNYDDSQSQGERQFIANVLDYDKHNKIACVMMRNRFYEGDELELLTPRNNLNEIIPVKNMRDENGESVRDAKLVQQKLFFDCEKELHSGDILRK